jgi:hypothetical protein
MKRKRGLIVAGVLLMSLSLAAQEKNRDTDSEADAVAKMPRLNSVFPL